MARCSLPAPHVFGPPADRDGAIAVLREVVELGINHIDTSDYYGPHVTNQIIKEALHPYPVNLRIVTKVGARRDAQGGWPQALAPDELRQAVLENLENLGLEALDVVNLRVGGLDAPTPGSLAEPFTTLAEMQQEGLIKHLGISTVTAEQIAEAQSIASIVCVQNFYNIAHRVDDALVDSLAEQGIAYVPYFPLGGFTPLQSSALDIRCIAAGGEPHGRRACVATATLPQPAAHPRHLIGRAPSRERRRRGARTPTRCRGRAQRDRWLTRVAPRTTTDQTPL